MDERTPRVDGGDISALYTGATTRANPEPTLVTKRAAMSAAKLVPSDMVSAPAMKEGVGEHEGEAAAQVVGHPAGGEDGREHEDVHGPRQHLDLGVG